MEFHTDREEALYTTLKRVLQNHIATHRLGYYQTLAACVPALGYVLYVMSESWEEAPGLIETTVAELQQRTHTRALDTLPPLSPFHDYAFHTDLSAEYQELGTALTTLLTTSGIEHNMSVAATWRVCVSLLADVLAMAIHDAEQTPAEVESYITSLREQLAALMRMWAEEGEVC